MLSLDAGRVVDFDTLLRRVWANREKADANPVRIFVRNLRRKLGDSAESPAPTSSTSAVPATAWRSRPAREGTPRRAPKRGSRSSAAGSSSRSPTRPRFKDRDIVARAFADLYRGQRQEFPPECRDADYEQRITAAYPTIRRSSTACTPTGRRW